jgi:hypothetical protein
VVNPLHSRQATIAEQLEERGVIEIANTGHFQFQQCILPGIHIDGIDVIESSQGVGKGVATCRRDDQEVVVRGQIENLLIDSRVFPTSIIDKIVSVNVSKDLTAQPFVDFFHVLGCRRIGTRTRPTLAHSF